MLRNSQPEFEIMIATARFTVGLVLVAAFAITGQAQEKLKIDDKTVAVVPSPWKLVDVDSKASLRGLHVCSPDDIWASGTGGTIVNSTDAGKTWRVTLVEGAEKLDFRDIHAIDDATVVAITSGTPARIYRSTNGGSNWKLCFESTDERIFLDSLSFWDDQLGLVMGDPIEEKLFLLGTTDGGINWKPFPQVPRTLPGEAGFAASGTNMITMGNHKVMIATGSDVEGSSKESSRVLVSENNGKSWTAASVPIGRNQSSGIFSICFANEEDGVAVGGDYQQPTGSSSNYATTRDGGQTWTTPTPRVPPSGYRSCVAVWSKGREINFVAVGPDGTDLSGDLGNKWHRISNEGFHSIDFSPDGQHGWASGSDGRLAQWVGPK